jgi:predicted RNA binding protein YcfA (HicA-like mRNA interferase family)
MSKIPRISGAEAVRALARIGYVTVRQKGSHVRLACVGRTSLTVPMHPELKAGTLRAIISTAGLTVDEFIALL